MQDTSLLDETNPQVVARILDQRFGESLIELEQIVEAIGTGAAEPHEAAERYFDECLSLTHHFIQSAQIAELVATDELLFSRRNRWLAGLAPSAPTSLWVAFYGLRTGLGLHLLSEVRVALRRPPLDPPLRDPVQLAWWKSRPSWLQTVPSLLLFVFEERIGIEENSIIERIMRQFGLDRASFGQLFGVDEKAVERWLALGVPDEKKAKLATVSAIGDLLARKLKKGLLPGVARRSAPAYDSRTMLELIENDKHDWLLEDVRATFDWAATA